MKLTVGLAVIALSLSMGLSTKAEAREFIDIYKECGLGAMIAPNKKDELIAVITNVTFDLGTTAISSNISSPETCKGGKAQTAAFLMESLPSVERDLAKGEGEYLTALLSMAGCNASDDNLVESVRADYAASMESTESDRLARVGAFYDVLSRNTAASCTIG